MPQAIAVAIAGFLFSIGAPLAVVNFVAVGFGATLIGGAVSIGLSLGASLLLGTGVPQAPRLKPSDGQQVIRQSVPQRWKHYGRVRIAGLIFWWQTEDAQGELYMGLVLNQGRIDAFEIYQIDDNTVAIDGSGDVTTAPYDTVTTKILTRLGVDPETAYSEIQTDFGYANIRGDSVATVLGIFDNFATAEDQQENYPNGYPRLRVTIRASVVWDPRDPAQERTDESTWQWSENPVICLLDYMTSSDGFALAWERFELNIDEWIIAANICEEQVWSDKDSRFEDRYRIAASYLFNEKPSDVARRFAETFDGRIWQRRDGTIGITAGSGIAVNVALGEDTIKRWRLERGQDRLTAVAGIRAQFMSPGHDFKERDAEPWPDGEAVLGLDDERAINLELTWVPSHGQARRLMQREYERANAKWRGQIVTGLAGLRVFDERYVRITISELGIADEVFEIGHYSLDIARMEVAIDLISATEIADPVRPVGGGSGLFYRGSGHIEDLGASPLMDLNSLDDGFPAQPGDLVVWHLRGRSTPTFSAPGGWTIVVNDASATRETILFKTINQADIDSPPQPFGSSGSNCWVWAAFNPADAGSPTLDLLDAGPETGGNPSPVSTDATAITEPHVLISAHGADRLSPMNSEGWTGETPDFAQNEHAFAVFAGSANALLHKVYPDGAGSDVEADQDDEGALNYQAIFIIKYV